MQSSDVMDNQMKVFDPLPLTKEGSDIVLQKIRWHTTILRTSKMKYLE